MFRTNSDASSGAFEGSFSAGVLGVDDVAELLVNHLLALVLGHELSTGVALVDLAGTHNLVLGVLNELVPVSEPAGKTGQGEEDSEHLSGDAEGLVDHTGVEINVRVELSLNEVLVTQSNSFQLHGDLDHGFLAHNLEDSVGKCANNLGTGVVVFIHTMSEAHQHLLTVLDILDELGNVFYRANLVEHAQDSLVGTTVTGSVEGSHSTGEGSVNISLGRGHVTDGSSGAVQLVLSVEDEQDFEDLHDFGVGSEVSVGRGSIHHVQEVLNVAKVLLGGNNGLSNSVTVASSSNGGSASEHSVDVLVSLLTRVVDFGTDVGGVGLRVERGHGGHQSAHHCHGVGIVSERLDEGLKTIVVSRVLHDLLGESAELAFSRQFTVDEQERSLKEASLFSELLNGIASVLKDTLVTVDVRDFGDAVHGVHVSGIVGTGHITRGGLDLGQVGGVDSTILDLELIRLA